MARQQDKDTNSPISEDILVMFPAAKNYPPQVANKKQCLYENDPLEELLRDIEEIEIVETRREKLTSGHQFKTHQLKTLQDKIAMIQEIQKRFHYYLDEIEFYSKNK